MIIWNLFKVNWIDIWKIFLDFWKKLICFSTVFVLDFGNASVCLVANYESTSVCLVGYGAVV